MEGWSQDWDLLHCSPCFPPPEAPEAGATAGWFTSYPWCPILWAQRKLFVKWVMNGDKDLPGQPYPPAQQDLLQAILSGCSWTA